MAEEKLNKEELERISQRLSKATKSELNLSTNPKMFLAFLLFIGLFIAVVGFVTNNFITTIIGVIISLVLILYLIVLINPFLEWDIDTHVYTCI